MKNKINYLLPLLSVFAFVLVLNTSNYDETVTEKVMNKTNKKQIVDDSAEYENYSEKKKRVKGVDKFDAPDKFYEYHQMIRTADGETKPGYKVAYQYKELEKAKKNRLAKSSAGAFETTALDWIERGPANVGGRTRGLVVDPDDPTTNTWFAGSVGGGVWKTTNSGDSWTHLTESLPNLSTSVIGQAASNPDVLYIGTGEGFGNVDAVDGNGLFKSTDRGNTWTSLESTTWNSNFRSVNRLVIDPADENIVVVATNTGIFRTVDGGANFTEVYDATSRVQDLRANPSNFNSIYASPEGSGIIISRDAGVTWREPLGKDFSGGRAEIVVSRSDTSRLYASVDGSNSRMFGSADAGENWVEVIEAVEDDLNGDSELGDEYIWLGAQGWYDNTIEVNPFNANEVFMGGIDLWKAEVSLDSANGIQFIDTTNIDAAFGYTPSGMPFMETSIGLGDDFWGEEVIDREELVTVEIRFGPGKTQKAHRFSSDATIYEDYSDVPFEVWDLDNNKQLMVSYNDRRNNGVFDLSAFRGEIILVNIVDYDASNPSSDIAQDGGAKYKNGFAWAIRNAAGVSWDADNLPEASLRFVVAKLKSMNRSTVPIVDGYNQYNGSQPDIHVDHHNLVAIPINEGTGSFRLLNANDGGVAISDDGGVTWRETDENGYNTSQFYGADKRPGANEYIGGMQDNGTWQTKPGENASASSKYEFKIGGDGYETAWNVADGNYIIGGSQYNRWRRTTDGGVTWSSANVGFDDWGNSANSPFISKIASSKIDPDLVFTISRQGAWRSEDFAENWTLTPISSNAFHNGQYFSQSQIKFSLADPNVVWAAAYMSGAVAPHVSKDGGLSFTKTNAETLGRVSGFETHPSDPATAYALFAFANNPKILKTTNYGQSWSDMSGFGSGDESTTGFPDVAVYSLLVMPYNTDIIWAGTDIGIIESTDGGASWAYADNGFPAASIWQMKIVDDQVVVATHGRGIWSVTLPELAGYSPPQLALIPILTTSPFQTQEGLLVTVEARSQYDSLQVLLNNQVAESFISPSVGTIVLTVPLTSFGSKTVQVVAYSNDRVLKSSAKTVDTIELLAARDGYVTSFETNTSDFEFNGLEVRSATAGFTSAAVHSPHPYPDETDLTMTLKVPIIVAAENAILEYEDVAIIETGTPGTVFGDFEFWDYVIVEGTKDGEWKHLLDGYDARFNSTWLNTYNASGSGNESMFVKHSINLLDHFNAGDQISIRFRLYADQNTVGWGWAIDNLSIQPSLVSVEDQSVLPATYELAQNYPNPFNPTTTIKFAVPKKSDVKLSIYNSVGELVTTLVNEVKAAGTYNVKWNARAASGVYFYRIDAGEFNSVRKMILLK